MFFFKRFVFLAQATCCDAAEVRCPLQWLFLRSLDCVRVFFFLLLSANICQNALLYDLLADLWLLAI